MVLIKLNTSASANNKKLDKKVSLNPKILSSKINDTKLDNLISELLGAGFSKTWTEMQSRYIFGTEDIPIQKWIASTLVSVKPKLQSKLEKIKLQLGMRHTDSNGWLKLTHVLDGGAAQLAGLAPGDLLASINGQRVTSARLDKILASLAEGQSIHLCFYRDDLEHEQVASLHASQLPTQFELIAHNANL
jgi:predicted metalloprotease with PDZ domain